MKSFIQKICIILALISCSSLAIAAQSFVVKRIVIEGLQNLPVNTVRGYMHVKEGQVFTYTRSNLVLQELYNSGFFYTINLGQQGNTLVVVVQERPMISDVTITGNDEIGTSKIEPVLKKLGVAVGDIYDPMKLQLFKTSLQQQYDMLGYAATTVSSTVEKLPHNRVSVHIVVDEGKIVKVNRIYFVGNNAFTSSKLKSQMGLTTPGLFTWFSHTDRYSPFKLEQDLQAITNFYFNNGFLHFRIVDKKIEYIQGHKRVNIYITVYEGPVYHIGAVKITGNTLNFEPLLMPLIMVKPGDLFSRQQIITSEQAINNFYADKAYAFNKISIIPDVDEVKHLVGIAFDVVPGQKVYVRQININGNHTTQEDVFRREMRQNEAAPYSLSDISESKRHIMLTSFVSDVNFHTIPVLGTNNQVDLDVNVKERPAGKASLQGGYSSNYGFLYGASITQPNFLGSGRYASIGFSNSQMTQQYSFNYFNPYYTWYHLGRGFSVYYNRNNTTKDQDFNLTPYIMNTYGGDLKYVFPFSDNTSVGFNVGYANIDLSHINGQGFLAPSATDPLGLTPGELGKSNNISRTYSNVKVSGSWSYDSRDRSVMPTQGWMNSLGVEVGTPVFTNNLSYYIVTDNFAGYIPLFRGFVLSFLGNFAYGNGLGGSYYDPQGNVHSPRLPFFFNFYGGGIGTVPGYRNNTLGPRYIGYCLPATATGLAFSCPFGNTALGGNLLTTAGVHLVLPNFFSPSLRIALTFDAGNVFQVPLYQRDVTIQPIGQTKPIIINDEAFALRNMRTSAGILVTWLLPGMGPIDLSLAFPLNKKKGDDIEKFQFAMGVSF